MSIQHIIGLATFVMIAIYLGSIGYLMRYLRIAYTMLWVDLGSPTLPWTFSKNRTWANPLGALPDGGLGILRFVFSNQYKKLDDPKLANLIWVVRTSLISGIVTMIILPLLSR
jgi:hypothetical protein